MPNTIVVDPKINRGSPSVPATNGGYSTVKQVVAFVRAGLTEIETAEELLLTKQQVLQCLEYVKLYPQVME